MELFDFELVNSYIICVYLPNLLIVRHAGNTNTVVIALPHVGNNSNDFLFQFGKASSAGSYMAFQIV